MLVGNEAYDPGIYDLISTTLITSNTASVTFNVSAFAGTYKHLQIRAIAAGSSSFNDNIDLTFNGDTGSNYSYHALYGDASSARGENSTSRANIAAVVPVSGISSYANQFSASVIDILDPYSTSKNTTVKTLTTRVQNGFYIGLHTGAWFNTSAINSITLTGRAYSIASGSRFSIYGLKG